MRPKAGLTNDGPSSQKHIPNVVRHRPRIEMLWVAAGWIIAVMESRGPIAERHPGHH